MVYNSGTAFARLGTRPVNWKGDERWDATMAKQGPKDVNELAFGMMRRFTGEDDDIASVDDEHAVSGSMGGAARAKRLTPAQRSKAAQKAARARWERADE